jgi:uncharacterized protein DUF4062
MCRRCGRETETVEDSANTPVVRVLRVFLASPGGVADERAAVRAVADEVNRVLRRHGWMIEVLGWEDRGPTGGRPQSDINADVELCDVFVGILGRRWGTPTGDSSSGFAEEWELASGRFADSGAPDLWLYFKDLRDGGTALTGDDAAQFEAVQAFRCRVEEDESAFHKSFVDVEDFTALLRPRLIEFVLNRSDLTRAEAGQARLDFGSAYGKDPVSLVAEGVDRLELATSNLDVDPAGAADVFAELAGELETFGFVGRTDELRLQAGEALLAADQPQAAVTLLREILGTQIWWLRLDDARHLLNRLGDLWPPELASELRGWRACARSTLDPATAAETLRDALAAMHAFGLDNDTVCLWTIMRCRCLLDENRSSEAAGCIPDVPEVTGEHSLELAMIWADALRAAGDPRANNVWQQLRDYSLAQARSDPRTTAWIRTRIAQDEVNQQRLDSAESSYVAAASRWSAISDGGEQAAAAFFSAGRAAELNGEFRFESWALREAAAAQRSPARTYTRRATELENSALLNRSLDPGDKHEWLRAALWLHQRSGLISPVMRCMVLLAQAYQDAGDHLNALRYYCRVGTRDGAKSVADEVSDKRAAAVAMAGDWPKWSTEARFLALAIVGRAAPSDVLEDLTTAVLSATTPTGKPFDNTHRGAADALAQLALAADDEEPAVVSRLTELAGDADYSLATAGRAGLSALATMGREVDVDFLMSEFIRDDRPAVPGASWVAERLTTPQRIAAVRTAARAGHIRALLALIAARLVDDDADLKQLCRQRTQNLLGRELGMTPDGSAVAGLIAFEAPGAIAAATRDETLKASVAEAFLNYALETRWPMHNRVSAVSGLWLLIAPGTDGAWLERLRPLAAPAADLDDDIAAHWQMWAGRGDLEAMALKTCASHELPEGPPAWLDAAVRAAAFDPRMPMRFAAWYAAEMHARWFSSDAAYYAFRDETAVALSALRAWGRRAGKPLPPNVAANLQARNDVDLTLALVEVVKSHPEPESVGRLCADTDGFVRAIARRDLSTGSGR